VIGIVIYLGKRSEVYYGKRQNAKKILGEVAIA
jgi:hypothetical protein